MLEVQKCRVRIHQCYKLFSFSSVLLLSIIMCIYINRAFVSLSIGPSQVGRKVVTGGRESQHWGGCWFESRGLEAVFLRQGHGHKRLRGRPCSSLWIPGIGAVGVTHCMRAAQSMHLEKCPPPFFLFFPFCPSIYNMYVQITYGSSTRGIERGGETVDDERYEDVKRCSVMVVKFTYHLNYLYGCT